MTEQVWWYATRAAGLMAWSTAVASVLLGFLLSPRLLGRRTSGTWLFDVHRFLGGLSAVFLLIHMGSIWLDAQIDFGTRDLLVPGESTWNPSAELLGVSAVTWGIAAAYSLIAVEITSILRRFIRDWIWKATHYLSLVTVGAGTVHAYEAGTDFGDSTAPAIAIAMSLIVVLASVIRMRRASSPSSPAAQAEMLEEMRQRLADLPIPPSMNEPVLELDEQTELPRRAPTAAEHTGMGMPGGEFPVGSDLIDPSLVNPAGENILLADAGMGLPAPPDEPNQPTVPTAPIDADALPRPTGLGPAAASIDAVVERLGPDPFAGIQGSDDNFDPGGWSSNLATPVDESFHDAQPGEFTPPHPDQPVAQPEPLGPTPWGAPSPTAAQPPATPTPPEPPPADVFDPQALLSEFQNQPADSAAGEPPPPAQESPPDPFGAQPPMAPPPQPHAAGPGANDAHAADVWEDALDSALHEQLPKLPNFEPMRLPEAGQPAPAPPVEPPMAPPPPAQAAPPEAPVVEPIPPTDTPAPQPSVGLPPSSPADDPQPPPLPVHAVDPTTGQADEDAYKAWLVEWLAFAERYGDAAPVDPSRVDG